MTYLLTNPDDAKLVQARLTQFGYLEPPFDGKFGGASRWALAELAKRTPSLMYTADSVNSEVMAGAKALPLDLRGGDFLARVVGAMQAKGYFINRHPDATNIVYVEGHDPSGKKNDNRNNVFNDLRIVFKIDGRPVQLGMWDATTEPSRKWTLQPMNAGGAFHIKPGQYKAWSLGMHHGTMEAWVQSGVLDGYRDLHKTFKRDLAHPVHGDNFAVNQHGGYDLPHDDMGNSSAGCLVGRSMDGHRKFMAITKKDPRFVANHKYQVMAAVLEQQDVD